MRCTFSAGKRLNCLLTADGTAKRDYEMQLSELQVKSLICQTQINCYYLSAYNIWQYIFYFWALQMIIQPSSRAYE